MFFINKLKTKKSGPRPAGGLEALPAQYKKSAALGRTASVRPPRQAPYQAIVISSIWIAIATSPPFYRISG
jgi:hypothetical protein